MLLNNKLCADAGTVNCPCRLAEYGKCIVCSRLGSQRFGSGGSMPEKCDCKWQGVCIYNEYLQNNGCIKGACDLLENSLKVYGGGEYRDTVQCEIQEIKWFEDDLAVMRIGVPQGMAEKASLPGSFVFVKAPEAESCFNFPVSVMRSDYENSTLELAIRVHGPKSGALMNPYRDVDRSDNVTWDKSHIGDVYSGPHIDAVENKSSINDACRFVELRGIYRNGLLGAEKLMAQGTGAGRVAGNTLERSGMTAGGARKNGGPRRVLCLTKGLGLAPVANYVRWSDGQDQIDIIADLEKINRRFAEYALCCGSGASVSDYVASIKYGRLPLNLSWAEEEKYDVIIISASDYYQQNIYVPEEKKVLSNNHTMCCGEGICGACMCVDVDGVEHRMCKSCKL